MDYKTVTIKEARNNFSEIIERVAIGGEFFLITKFGKKKAILSPAGKEDRRKSLVKRQAVVEETAGMWKDRKDMGGDPVARLRKGRTHLITDTKVFDNIIKIIPTLKWEERETLGVLLDEDFSKVMLSRRKEVDRLRKEGKLLTLSDIQKEFGL